MTTRRIVLGALLVSATLAQGVGSATADCPRIPIPTLGTADPNAGQAPPAPQQITNTMSRQHFVGNSIIIDGISFPGDYCLYSPPATTYKRGLLLYLHGAQPLELGTMDPMLQFIARSGYYIVYPYIQDSVGDILNQSVPQLRRFPALGLNALSGALTQLQSQNITNVAVAGYSLGAIAAARVAAMWKEQNKSPPIRAIVLHEPAGLRPQIVLPGIVIPIDFTHANDWSSKFALAAIPCDTFLLIVQAQSSTVQPDLDNSAARKIWHNLWRIARYAGTSGNRYHRNFLLVPDDVDHSVLRPSNHLVPTAFPLTSMDYYGYWNPLRGGLNRVFAWGPPISSPYCNTGDTVSLACRGTRWMGTWIDGGPATQMKNAADLDVGVAPQSRLFAPPGIPERICDYCGQVCP